VISGFAKRGLRERGLRCFQFLQTDDVRSGCGQPLQEVRKATVSIGVEY
jgi:hypothetical protein